MMAESTFAERRLHQRHPLATSIQFFHGPAQRDFQGRCVDISFSGMKMYVPPNVPAHVGQPIRITLGSVHRPEFSVLNEEPQDATIVRVNRDQMVSDGHMGVAVRFAAPGA